MRGKQIAPIFDGTQARDLPRSFSDIEQLEQKNYSLTSPILTPMPIITFPSPICILYIYRAPPTTNYQILIIYRPTRKLPTKYLSNFNRSLTIITFPSPICVLYIYRARAVNRTVYGYG